MKILVTGANGYLGRGIIESLLDLGHQVIAIDFSVDSVDNRAIKIVGDIFNEADPFLAFNQPDCLLHLAWRDGFKHFSDTHFEDFPKHKVFLEKMCSSGIKSISVMGTMHEIGFFEGSINENTPCNPLSYYGIAKNALREVTKIICDKYGVEYKWLRAYYIVSNSPNGSSVFSKIIQADKNGERTFPFTSGMNQYDFLDYQEFCDLVALATVQRVETGIINICRGRPEALANRVERFIRENHLSIQLEYGVYPDRPYDSKAIWGNSRIIESIIERHQNGTD